ncbi:MAG: hypothetical protein M0027_03690 [Candidatus Dormibacteraeota bacterium]|jgi:hypothetical protein|nr:hypothetical protein [Candidatus Dormibacteraeota bacterium]
MASSAAPGRPSELLTAASIAAVERNLHELRRVVVGRRMSQTKPGGLSAYGDFSVSDFHLRLGPQHTGTGTGPRRDGPLLAVERTTDAPRCTVRRSQMSVAQARDTIADDPVTPQQDAAA